MNYFNKNYIQNTNFYKNYKLNLYHDNQTDYLELDCYNLSNNILITFIILILFKKG
jgi:hypothetical protein